MAKIMISDDIFSPNESIIINYAGSNTFRVCQIVRPLMEKIMQVESKDIFERIFKWDILEENRAFVNFWTTKKEEDRWTGVLIKFVIQGRQHSQTKKGNVRIEISGYIETSYEYSNPFQLAFWKVYNKMFYYKRRRQYLERGREYAYAIRDEILKELKIPREAA